MSGDKIIFLERQRRPQTLASEVEWLMEFIPDADRNGLTATQMLASLKKRWERLTGDPWPGK
jgi:hypothetical protein